MENPIQVFGYSALERMAEAPKFNLWMYQTIVPYINGKILEIGSGIGNLSQYFIRDNKNVFLTDYDEEYVQLLKKRFPENTDKIFRLDLNDASFKKKFDHLENTFDSIFLLNVLEHIEDDFTAIAHCRFLLKPGGSLLVLVPSYSFLYSRMDRLLGHYRRYTSQSLNQVMKKNGLEVGTTFHFNILGIAGWFWNKLFNQAEISETKMKLYNRLVPFGRILDKVFLNKMGLSVITVAKKSSSEK